VSHVSDPHLMVLHSLRLKGFAVEMAIAELTGLAPKEIDSHLAALSVDGLARHREGRISGWGLTPAGREAHAQRLAADLHAANGRPVVEKVYQRFLELNESFLAVCTDWQVRYGPGGEQIVNDHKDAEYDAAALGRLRDIDAQVQPLCAELGAAMSRFSSYGARLAEALAKTEAGDPEWFTGTLVASYHTVWFELHEDLLATLGQRREGEENPQ
jgi:hypothetical protein